MINKSTTARHCHAVLCILLEDLRSKYDKRTARTVQSSDDSQSLSHISSFLETSIEPGLFSSDGQQTRKRQKINSPRTPNPSYGANTEPISSDHQNTLLESGARSDDNLDLRTNVPFEFQWMQDSMPGTQLSEDIFGNLSWGALFQNDAAAMNCNYG